MPANPKHAKGDEDQRRAGRHGVGACAAFGYGPPAGVSRPRIAQGSTDVPIQPHPRLTGMSARQRLAIQKQAPETRGPFFNKDQAKGPKRQRR